MFEATWNAKDCVYWPNITKDIRGLMGAYGQNSNRSQ